MRIGYSSPYRDLLRDSDVVSLEILHDAVRLGSETAQDTASTYSDSTLLDPALFRLSRHMHNVTHQKTQLEMHAGQLNFTLQVLSMLCALFLIF